MRHETFLVSLPKIDRIKNLTWFYYIEFFLIIILNSHLKFLFKINWSKCCEAK